MRGEVIKYVVSVEETGLKKEFDQGCSGTGGRSRVYWLFGSSTEALLFCMNRDKTDRMLWGQQAELGVGQKSKGEV